MIAFSVWVLVAILAIGLWREHADGQQREQIELLVRQNASATQASQRIND